MANVKPLVLYNGQYKVMHDDDNILDKETNSIAKQLKKDIEPLQKVIIKNHSRTFLYHIFKTSSLSSGSFYDNMRAGSHRSASGSLNGWSQSSPMIIPFNCKIDKLFLNFQSISYDWRNTSGNVYLDLGFVNHNHNNVFNERILRFETLNGQFINGQSDSSGFKYIIEENNIYEMLSNNYFYEGELIGVLQRSDVSIPGRIYNIRQPYIGIQFKEVDT